MTEDLTLEQVRDLFAKTETMHIRASMAAFKGADEPLRIAMTREARIPVVRMLATETHPDSGKPWTQRQIAAEVGVSHTTVDRDLGTDVPADEPVHAQSEDNVGTDVPAEPTEAQEVSIENEYRALMTAMKEVVAMRRAIAPVRAHWTPEQRGRMQRLAAQLIRLGESIAMQQV
ncbi:MAG: hypothetical protein H0U60_11875 [Blastocatellia bacterium]|nr:hypothetical protein [Blastocatellia bacterium]